MTFKQDTIRLKRLFLWMGIFVYTFSLPEVIRLYRWLSTRFSKEMASQVPLIIVICLLVIYTTYCLLTAKTGRGSLSIFISIGIVFLIFKITDIPTKRIHIIEYIIMCWLLYEALQVDYEGKAGLILTFILAGLLGVVDEILQGFHPRRYYGLTDMVVNALSAVIGILILAVVRKPFPSGNKTVVPLKACLVLIFTTLVELVIVLVSCYQLWSIATYSQNLNLFPLSVIVLDIICCLEIIGLMVVMLLLPLFREMWIPVQRTDLIFWFFGPKSIFLIILSLTLLGYFLGLEFR
ncbi:VanZ family protein [candidate division CSSED10-310 bacterium]|uniref:VanZ family protein n=1 Tax=candidate division CSSED10-310 bacterium TaxID=2855610 RepID=A0ABV6YT42_UNCC1